MMKKTKRTVWRHFLFWSLIWSFYIFFLSYKSDDFLQVLGLATFLLPITILPTHWIMNILIPKYLESKKYIQFVSYTLCVLLLIVLSTLLLLLLSIAYVEGLSFEKLPPMSRSYTYLVVLVLLVVTLVSFLTTYQKQITVEAENRQLQNQLLTAQIRAKEQELSHLKSQIHPHFLFNTLNTIYGLAIKKSTDTPNIILKLSDLLDYVLYQTSKPSVPLLEEIKHLERYIDLEKVRFKDTLKLAFSQEVDQQEITIAPMLLLPFVENAFKHGSIINGFLSIEIQIFTKSEGLFFSVKNTNKPKSETKEGLGIKNVQERLSILYPNKHHLEINHGDDWFEVQLKIENIKQSKYA